MHTVVTSYQKIPSDFHPLPAGGVVQCHTLTNILSSSISVARQVVNWEDSAMLLAKSTKHERVEDHDQGNQEEQGKQKERKLKKKQITEEEEKRETTWKT